MPNAAQFSRLIDTSKKRLRWLRTDLKDWVRKCAHADQSQLILWVPVALAIGIGFYFSLSFEPSVWLAMMPLILIPALIISHNHYGETGQDNDSLNNYRAYELFRNLLIAVLLVSIGFALSLFRTQTVAAPILDRETRVVTVFGILNKLDEGPRGRRFIIDVDKISGFTPNDTPEKIRLTWRGDGFEPLPGQSITVRAVLNTPPPPTAPGAYDFARQLFFERIGAVGYAITAPEQTNIEYSNRKISTQIETIRINLMRRIIRLSGSPEEAGPIAAALVTGKRQAIPEDAKDALRGAGLAHLLAISGLHMGLVAGLLFYSIRAALALNERWALHYPIKKWAAFAALIGGFIYLLLSGSAWSARRAFIMAGIMFFAIIMDRRALSLRNVAIAATVILLIRPEALLQAGFQMSFAAVTVLIAVYEYFDKRTVHRKSILMRGALGKIWYYMKGLAVTSILAGLATAPFGLYHFNAMAAYSLFGNIAAMPIVVFWIMPMAVIGMLLLPLGLDGVAWKAMSFGIEGVMNCARFTADWPGAIIQIPSFPLYFLITIVLGVLWFCLNKSSWRWCGVGVLPFFLLAINLNTPPDIYIDDELKNVSVRTITNEKAHYVVLNRMQERFAVGSWLEMAGVSAILTETPRIGRQKNGLKIGHCDREGCTLITNDTTIAISKRPSGLSLDCHKADIVLAQYFISERLAQNCPALLIDRGDLRDTGSVALYVKNGFIKKVESNKQHRGRRPWTLQD